MLPISIELNKLVGLEGLQFLVESSGNQGQVGLIGPMNLDSSNSLKA